MIDSPGIIQTSFGNVSLRSHKSPNKRPMEEVILSVDQTTKVTVQKGWVAELDEDVQRNHYRQIVMQVMQIASSSVALQDMATRAANVDPITGLPRTKHQVDAEKQRLEERLRGAKDGSAPIACAHLGRMAAVLKSTEREWRHLPKFELHKRSKKLGMIKVRYFTIERGRLNVYRWNKKWAREVHVYDLKDVDAKNDCKYENAKTTREIAEKFEKGWEHRVMLRHKDRFGPMYLYADTAQQARNWVDAVRMSKYIQNQSDQAAMRMVVGKVTGSQMVKGWSALFTYSNEMQNLQKNLKNFAMRFAKADQSRSWSKASMVFQMRKQKEQLRAQQKDYAMKLLAEKMTRLSSQATRELPMVRSQIITQIQAKFRHYRREKIFDRNYALGSSASSRVQQAQKGIPMDACFSSLGYADALRLVLSENAAASELLDKSPDLLHSRKSTFSEVNIPVQLSNVAVSDSLSMLTFSPLAVGFTHSHLAMAKWAEFVNLDQISSVTLFTERMMSRNTEGGDEIALSQMGGVWLTVNGPRICWCKRNNNMLNPETREATQQAVGAKDGQAVAQDLVEAALTNRAVRWLKLTIAPKNAYIPKVPDPLAKKDDKEANVIDTAPLHSYLKLNILGRCFYTSTAVGESPQYPGTFEVDVPIAKDETPGESLAGLDMTPVSVEVIKFSHQPTTLWAGMVPLWKMFAPETPPVSPEGIEAVTSLSSSLANGKGHALRNVYMIHPSEQQLSQLAFGSVELDITASVENYRNDQCISPELQGCGLSTTLYSTHRGAWFNPRSQSEFNSNNVPNFLELKLGDLTLPIDDKVDTNHHWSYYIEVKCNGVAVCSQPLHRAKQSWAAVMSNCEPGRISFQGEQLFLPLPPGFWIADPTSITKRIELMVHRQEFNNMQPMDFNQAQRNARGQNRQTGSAEKCYHTTLVIDGMAVDKTPKHVNVALSVPPDGAPEFNVTTAELTTATGIKSAPASYAKLILDANLRDRDFVRMTTADYTLSQRSLFVGDAAMLLAEEPMLYPKSADDFRRRMLPGNYGEGNAGKVFRAELRDPCLSHEYSMSGLANAVPKVPFRSKNVPAHYHDLIPHKYVMPPSEQEFQKQNKEGVFWRVMDDLAEEKRRNQGQQQPPATVGQKAPSIIVTNLTHTMRKIPITVVAVYPNKTCDVELASSFVEEWQSSAKQFGIPGSVVIQELKPPPQAVKGQAQFAPKSVFRVLLKGVPLTSLVAVHASSFNVYDARFSSTDDYLRAGYAKNDRNPRAMNNQINTLSQSDRKGGYLVKAGPLPSDCRASCQYEWTLHLHAKTEEEMYHFVAMLRQCARMNHFQQVLRLRDDQSKSNLNSDTAGMLNVQYDTGPRKTSTGGFLEVVLVEARRLQKRRVQKYQNMTEAVMQAVQTEYNCLVLFTVSSEAHPQPYPEDHEMEPGQTMRIFVHEWIARGYFAISLKTYSGATSLKLTVNPVEKKMGLNHLDASGNPGEQRETMLFPPEFATAHARPQDLRVDFTLTNKAWEITINGEKRRDLDFDHRLALSDKTVKAEFDELPRAQVFLLRERELLAVKGSKMQRSPIVGPSVSPNWSAQDGLQGTGGWVFKTPEIDPRTNPTLDFEMTLQHSGFGGIPTEIGKVQQSIAGGAIGPGGTQVNLCDGRNPFHNLWLPLTVTDPATGHLVPKPSGEIHIMTRWVPNVQPVNKVLPKTCRAFLMQELRPKLNSAQLRLPIYDTQERLVGYNPNLWADFPQSRSESMAIHAEQLYNSVPYLDCVEGRQTQMWTDLEATFSNNDKPKYLADLRIEWIKNTAPEFQAKAHNLNENLRRGIPPLMRLSRTAKLWSEITHAAAVEEEYVSKADDASQLRELPELAYLALLEYGRPIKSDAMLQIQEDVVTAASWESSRYPEIMDRHLQRLRRAQNVCIALIAFSYTKASSSKVEVELEEPKGGQQPRTIGKTPSSTLSQGVQWTKKVVSVPDYNKLSSAATPARGVTYCESLLLLAFYLLLPQIDEDAEKEKRKKGAGREGKRDDPSDPTAYYRRESFMTYNPDARRPQAKIDRDFQEESRVFWLLYTLIGSPQNGEYADYFATMPDNVPMRRQVMSDIAIGGGGPTVPVGADKEPGSTHTPIAQQKGAMRDIHILNCILMRLQPDLWIHLTSIGFNLLTVFYGAFMRWFATYMPTSSVFRFWDFMFSESTHLVFTQNERDWEATQERISGGAGVRLSTTNKPSRHALIDLAYGILKARSEKLRVATSALEAKDCLLSFMESLYDPSLVIEMVAEAEKDLWETLLSEHLHQQPQFVKDVLTTEGWYQKASVMQWAQNYVLDQLVSHATVDVDGSRRAGNNMAMGQADPMRSKHVDRRMTTRNVGNYIIVPFHKAISHHGSGPHKYGGMWRPLPKHVTEIGPPLNRDLKHQLWHFFGQAADMVGIHTEDLMRIRPHSQLTLPGTSGEPTAFDKSEWAKSVKQAVGTDWNPDVVNNLYEVFQKPPDIGNGEETESRMSLTEFFLALICCSKGTVGERMLELFKVFAHKDKLWKMSHIVPVMHHAKAVVDKVEGSVERDTKKVFQPPDDGDVAKTVSLHFKVMCHELKQEKLLGEVFVTSLHPFTLAGMVRPQAENYTIWGARMGGRGFGGGGDQPNLRRSIGELNMGISWVPGDRHEVGQLCVTVHYIRFDPNSPAIDMPHKKNPYIILHTYDDSLREKEIQRWDPRTGTRKVVSAVTLGMKFGGAYKGHMEWGETMRKDPTGYHLISRDHTEKGHGWDSLDAAWKWSRKWGEQYSIEDFSFRKKMVETEEGPNCISVKACRAITLAILRRSLVYVTNRQAMLIADATFNRAGAVPGILDAIIVKGERIPEEYGTTRQLIDDYTFRKEPFIDVKHNILLEHERQVNNGLGEIDLWADAEGSITLNLSKALDVKDIFPGMTKVMWIRYVRGGDGERLQVQIPVNGDGNFTPQRIGLDMPNIPGRGGKAQAQMNITKEEFVACMQDSPLLSESLRRLCTVDQSTTNLPPWNPIKLDVTLTDPSRQYEDDDMFDVQNVRQAVLFEVWDYDRGAYNDDFMGECWLPALGTLHKKSQKYVLRVTNADTASKTSTRPDKRKHLKEHIQCTGEIHIEASWQIPAEPDKVKDQPESETLQDRVKREELMHTGRLQIKVLKAENLRATDVGTFSGKRSSDPYVAAYMLNEASGEWKHNLTTKLVEPLFKTKSIKGTLNPEWNEEFKPFMVKTGAFEKKTKQHWHLQLTNRQKQAAEDEHALQILEQDELRLYFGDEDRERKNEPGARHKVKIYLGDTVRQFKNKLLLACQKEGELETRDAARQAKYKSVHMSVNHVVTVFVPSEKLRSLFNQAMDNARAYKRLYKLEEQDPSFWQPLDPIRTFSNYASTYGFGLQINGPPGQKDPAQRLRIAEATPEYKMRNQRYKHFEEELLDCTSRVDDTDSDKMCFGHGLYIHQADGNSTEWRPVLVERPDASGDMMKRQYHVRWLYAKGGQDVSSATEDLAELDEESVLLAPRVPHILGSGTLEHQMFLDQAADLREQGLSDHDIAAKLNEKLKAKFQMAKQADEAGGKTSDLMMPALITVSEVQHFFKKREMEGKTASAGSAPASAVGSAASTPRQSNNPDGSSPGGRGSALGSAQEYMTSMTSSLSQRMNSR